MVRARNVYFRAGQNIAFWKNVALNDCRGGEEGVIGDRLPIIACTAYAPKWERKMNSTAGMAFNPLLLNDLRHLVGL